MNTTYAKLLSDITNENKKFCKKDLLLLLAFLANLLEQPKYLSTNPTFTVRLDCYSRINNKAAKILGKMQDSVPIELEHSFQQAVTDLEGGMPLAYILGLEDFAGRSFMVGPGVLVPREDSEILLQQALAFCRKLKYPKVLELCCGTACISISLWLETMAAEVWASDISTEALAYAEQNRAYYQPIEHREMEFHLRQSDLLANVELQQKYSLILANPPYLSNSEFDKRNSWLEPMLALRAGADGFALLGRIVAETYHYLKPGGTLLLEAAPWQMHELSRLLYANGYGYTATHCDNAGFERAISACRPD